MCNNCGTVYARITSEMYNKIRTLIANFTFELNVVKALTQDGKNTVNVCLVNMAATGASETTDEDDDQLIPLKSEVELAVEQLKAKQQDVTIYQRP